MRIRFINPPSSFLEDQGALPPLGLFYVIAALGNEHDISMVDVGLGDKIPEDADIYCFTCNITQSDWCKENLPYYKKIGRTIIGGAYPSITMDSCGADQMIVGEGEETILQAIEYPDKPIFYNNGNIPINSIKYPARKLCNAKRYKYWINNKPSTPIITSRGCPFACHFCSKGVFNKVRFRDIDNIIKEIEEIKALGFSAIRIYDDSLLCNRKRAVELLKELKHQDIVWKAEVNSKNIDMEIARLMASAGCIDVAIGIESGSQKILNNVNKQTTIAQHTKAVKILRTVGIKTRAYLIVGLPGESWDTIIETKNWLLSARPDSMGIGIFCPYPGSDIYNNPDKYDIKIWTHNKKDLWFRGKEGKQNCFVSTSNLTREDIIEAKKSLEEVYS